ncbi:acetate--CoA ligase family protein [Chloroflexota bacterium]
MVSKLESIFNADSIAIIGASETPGKAGERRTRSLIEGGFKGKIYPVNSKRDSIFSIRTYPGLKNIEGSVDLVVVVVPVNSILSAISEGVEKDAKGAVIITAGLGETGEDGKRIEGEIVDISRKSGMTIIGPNCSGIFSAQKSINLLGVPPIQKGPFSVVAQSGNVIDSVSHYARLRKIGFSKIASVGNGIDVNFVEYLEFLGGDSETEVILLYMEGIKDGGKFVEVAREVSKVKPIVAIKVGRSEAGKRAASTHTGSVAGSELIVEAALNQAGIIRAYSVDEMFDIARALVGLPKPEGNRVVVLSEGGGDNAITVDNIVMQGLEVNILDEETQDKLKPFILEGLKPSNPIDYGGTAEENPHKIIPACCQVCMENDEVDMIIITGFFGGFREIIAPQVEEFEKDTSRKLVELVRRLKKPILVNTSFANEKIDSLSILEQGGILVAESSERVARCASALVKVAENQRHFKEIEPIRRKSSPDPSVVALINRVKKERSNMLETESRVILGKYGVTIPPARLARDKKEAVAAAEELGLPVVLKISSLDIIHKSDAGGVRLNLQTLGEVELAFEQVMEGARRVTSRIDGALVLAMMPPGEECIIGMARDKQFGPVLMFGLGGIFTEFLKDFSLRVFPLTQNDINEMISGIRGFPLLCGIRGRSQKDLLALNYILRKISHIAIDYPDIDEIDLNPVVVYETGACVLDSRIIVRR